MSLNEVVPQQLFPGTQRLGVSFTVALFPGQIECGHLKARVRSELCPVGAQRPPTGGPEHCQFPGDLDARAGLKVKGTRHCCTFCSGGRIGSSHLGSHSPLSDGKFYRSV